MDRNPGITNIHWTGLRRELIAYNGGWEQSAIEYRGKGGVWCH